MDSTQKQILNDVLAEARAEMQHGAVRDHAQASIIGNKIMQAALWESMDEAEMNCFGKAVMDFSDWLKPSYRELSDFLICDMTLRCIMSKSTRSK